ncbi:PseG/SpsG family protein [Planctomycetota bacterium]
MPEQRKVYIRLDADHTRGMGHIFRMSILAEILIADGVEVTFIIRSNQAAEEILQDKAFKYLSYPISMSEQEIINSSLKQSDELPMLWIFDILSTQPEWIELVKQRNIKVVCFDDTEGGLVKADLVINSIADSWGGYERNEVKAEILEGFDYSILSPEVMRYRKPRSIPKDKCLSVGITMGGSDSHGSTVVILKAVCEMPPDKYKFNIFAGPHFLHQEELSALLDSIDRDVLVQHSPVNFHKELDTMDIIICAGGITLYEVCTMGLPAIAFANEPHEERTIDYFASLDACIPIGSVHHFDINELKLKIRALLQDRELLNKLSVSALSSVTSGTDKCVQAIYRLIAD